MSFHFYFLNCIVNAQNKILWNAETKRNSQVHIHVLSPKTHAIQNALRYAPVPLEAFSKYLNILGKYSLKEYHWGYLILPSNLLLVFIFPNFWSRVINEGIPDS